MIKSFDYHFSQFPIFCGEHVPIKSTKTIYMLLKVIRAYFTLVSLNLKAEIVARGSTCFQNSTTCYAFHIYKMLGLACLTMDRK